MKLPGGNVFRSVCPSVIGGMCGWWGGRAWLGERGPCLDGGVCGWGAWVADGGHAWLGTSPPYGWQEAGI